MLKQILTIISGKELQVLLLLQTNINNVMTDERCRALQFSLGKLEVGGSKLMGLNKAFIKVLYAHSQHFGKSRHGINTSSVMTLVQDEWSYSDSAFNLSNLCFNQERQQLQQKAKKKMWIEGDRRLGNSVERNETYRVFCRSQNLFNHHTVSCKGAPVERVGPIRTEGAEATCYHATQCRGQQQVTGRETRHKTKSKESITTCNLQGFHLLDRESKSNMGKIEKQKSLHLNRDKILQHVIQRWKWEWGQFFALRDRGKEEEEK